MWKHPLFSLPDGKAIQPILVEHLLCARLRMNVGDRAANKASLTCGIYMFMLETGN